MRNRKAQGFTLIELLIVIAIIGILAAVLIPNLLNARRRAFDTAAQTCLKEIASQEEMEASVDPWEYTASLFAEDVSDGEFDTDGDGTDDLTMNSCNGVRIVSAAHSDGTAGTATTTYAYNAQHENGANVYNLEAGAGVVVHSAAVAAGAALPTTEAP